MVTITPTTAKQSIFTVLSGKTYYPVSIVATVTETNPALTRVGATLDWNDGTPAVVFTPGSSISINTARNLPLGTYYITLSAFNYAQPAPQRTAYYFSVQVQPQQIMAIPQDYLFGPILPLDNQFPNAEQWSFNTSTNLDVLKSSVKMLLITTRGERIMHPTYGTMLRRIVFEPSTSSISTVIRQEITEALTQFEPRVALDSFNIQKADKNGKSVVVHASFLSKVSQSTFSLALPFTQ